MMDLSITPDKYKQLWWDELIAQMTEEKKFFTLPELQEFTAMKTGKIFASGNFVRAALKFAPIFKTNIKTENNGAGGRPATYYCSTKI